MLHLSERIELQKKAQIPDAEGGMQMSWAGVGEYWAHIKALTPGRRYESHPDCGKNLINPCFLMTLRKQVPLRGDMRIAWRGMLYQLISYPIRLPTQPFLQALIQPIGV